MSNWQQEGATEAEVREDAPEPEDERWEMDVPPADDSGTETGGWDENEGSPHEGEGGQADEVA